MDGGKRALWAGLLGVACGPSVQGPEVWPGLGVAARGLRHLEAAEVAYVRAIALAPADSSLR